jgi:hypothetical protein
MELSDIVSVSGKGGLFKIINPTRGGVILETLDAEKKKIVVSAQTKMSVLSDIAIYTTKGEGSTPLSEVLFKVHTEFKGDIGLDKNADGSELQSFMKQVLPDYDADRVYTSDIKKLVVWYAILAKEAADVLTKKEAPKEDKLKDLKKETKSQAHDKGHKASSAKAKSAGGGVQRGTNSVKK